MQRFNNSLKLIILIFISLFLHACAAERNHGQSKGISTPFSKGTTQKRQALIVGVSDYAGSSADLGGIERDVARMKQLFTSWGFDIKVLYDNDSMDIMEQLNSYTHKLGSDDFFAFYYTGHGSRLKDENGDESDGKDETLVLSDGNINKHLIDDILYQKFNSIKAKKLIFFDSCHSGTAFRSLNQKSQPKTINAKDVTESFVMSSSKGMKVADNMNRGNGEFIVFSSSQDTEESLATPTGSLFTNSLSEVFSDTNLANKSLNSINGILVTKVVNYAKETDGTPHHPNISFSHSSIGTKSLQEFVTPKSTTKPSSPPMQIVQTDIQSTTPPKMESLQSTLDALIVNNKIKNLSLTYDKSTYTTGELVKFKIDTLGKKGFLSIFYVDSDEVTVLYPNPYVSTQQLGGKYTFPNDLSNGKFDIEAYKSCTGCQEEQTTIYVLLSPEPIDNLKNINSNELLSFKKESKQSKALSRAVRVKTQVQTKSTQPRLSRYQFRVK